MYNTNDVEVTKTVKISLCAEQWQLFTCSMDCDQAAEHINRSIERSFNQGDSREVCQKKALEAMKMNSKYGAMDSEPLWVLEDLIDFLYQKEAR